MSTAITADDLLAAFKRRGVKFRFYKDLADFRTHNRNAAGANTSATPGGFGPIRGVVWHNYGSSGSDVNQLAYLYRGDGPTSSKPGPLCLGGIVDDGTIVLMGWGTATHAGPADPKVEARARANSMPLNGELTPTTNGKTPGTVPINPFYLGFEMCHGPEGPTAAQKASLVLATAAILEMLGPLDKYSGGSVMMHRELTTGRSDPQGVPKDGALRAQVTATLKRWATPTPVPTPQEVDMQLNDIIPGTNPPLTVAQCLVRGAYAYGQIISSGSLAKAVAAQGGQINRQADALGALADDVENIPDTVRTLLKDASVTVDVNFAQPTPPA